jgi:ABC-2 type transport system ATP-binding protein
MSEILLRIKNIKKQYKQKNHITDALKGVSLDIYKGEIITLLGVNGAGKSTLSSIIATLHPATEGDILFEEASIYNNLIRYRAQLGFCPQKPNLDATLTLDDNLRFSGRFYGMTEEAIDQRIKKLSQQFGLGDYLDQKSPVLSGGYRQRFMLARSIMHNPRLVLLDEPTVGLDPHIRRQLWALIKELKKEGVTIILTTHYLDEAEHLSDRVCMLDKGLIKLIDTPENLLTDFKKNNLEDVFLALMQETKEAI